MTRSERRRLAHRLERHQEQRRLADAGLAADEDERRGDEPAAEDAVELRNSCPDALGLGGVDVDEPEQRLGHGGAGGRGPLLDERPERVAARAFAEPAAGGVAAFGTRVFDGGLRHRARLRAHSDALRAGSVPNLSPRARAPAEAARAGRATRSRAPRGCTPRRRAASVDGDSSRIAAAKSTAQTGCSVSETDVTTAGSRGSEIVISSQPTTCELSASRISQPCAEGDGVRSRSPTASPISADPTAAASVASNSGPAGPTIPAPHLPQRQ